MQQKYLSRRRFLFSANGSETVHNGIVSFVTRILENRARTSPHRDLARPRPLKRFGIVDRKLVQQRVLVDSGKAFYQTHVLAGPSKICFVRKIHRFDDKRIAIPVSTRITEP